MQPVIKSVWASSAPSTKNAPPLETHVEVLSVDLAARKAALHIYGYDRLPNSDLVTFGAYNSANERLDMAQSEIHVAPHNWMGFFTLTTTVQLTGSCAGNATIRIGSSAEGHSGDTGSMAADMTEVRLYDPAICETPDRDSAQELLALIDQARLRPDLYPPYGNSSGASMTPCNIPLKPSDQLTTIVQAHNEFISNQPMAWVAEGTNAHLNPDGHFVGDPGEPMDKAGYHSYRAEVFSAGRASAAATVADWMQNDDKSGWQHRNIILACLPNQEVGASVITGGGYGYYYFVDFGVR